MKIEKLKQQLKALGHTSTVPKSMQTEFGITADDVPITGADGKEIRKRKTSVEGQVTVYYSFL